MIRIIAFVVGAFLAALLGFYLFGQTGTVVLAALFGIAWLIARVTLPRHLARRLHLHR